MTEYQYKSMWEELKNQLKRTNSHFNDEMNIVTSIIIRRMNELEDKHKIKKNKKNYEEELRKKKYIDWLGLS